ADRIAFIAIAVNSPIFQPLFVFSDPQYEILVVYTPRILSTFFNAYLLAIPVPFLIFAYNFINQYLHPEFYNLSNESRWTRFLIRFIGYPRHIEDLKEKMKKNPWHFDFLEEFQEKNGWQISFRVRLDKPEIDLNRKEEIISHAQSKEKISIWVQPSLPFIFILMLGYIADFIVGNILFGVLFLIFKSM
ncbi:MAG: hypothetical protein JSV04_08080, partial [Candidatus Heimdallarchaeota archaeon]